MHLGQVVYKYRMCVTQYTEISKEDMMTIDSKQLNLWKKETVMTDRLSWSVYSWQQKLTKLTNFSF